MKSADCRISDEVFTHIDDGTGEVRHFNASAMQRAAPAFAKTGRVALLTVAIDPEFISFVLRVRGIERPRVERLAEPYLSMPILGADMDDGSVLTVDGHHRLVALYERGVATYEIYIFKKEDWLPFIVEDLQSVVAQWAVAQAKGV